MGGLGFDHVISGPIKGLTKTASNGANTETQTDVATLWLNRPSALERGQVHYSGAVSVEKIFQVTVKVLSV